LLEESKCSGWLRFRCYRAVKRALQDKIASNNIVDTVIAALKSVSNTERGINKISRTKLRATRAGQTHAVLDALPIFEENLYQKLRNNSIDDQPALTHLHHTLSNCHPAHADAFIMYFKSAWLKKNSDLNTLKSNETFEWKWRYLLTEHLSEYVTLQDQHIYFKENILMEKWPVDTSHGNKLLPTYQIKKLAEHFAEKCHASTAKPVKTQVPTIISDYWNLFYALVFTRNTEQQQRVIKDDINLEEQAREIWRAAVGAQPDAPEGQYDDHAPLFHGIMSFTMQYLMEVLKQQLLTLEMTTAIKMTLKTKVSAALQNITEQSTVKKFFGLAYKSFNLKNLRKQAMPYATPWLSDASQFYTTLKMI
ncbi:MAG TPA: hypothetical protein VI522_00750, partial [Gammaproteobacteria bacterium]|nr:hypothetical protein [Gammaproteobacteria bacterium]